MPSILIRIFRYLSPVTESAARKLEMERSLHPIFCRAACGPDRASQNADILFADLAQPKIEAKLCWTPDGDNCQTTAMSHLDVICFYIASWNGRDAEALVDAFTRDGKFCNPHTHPGIGGEALVEYVKGVWTAFPDFHIDLLNCGEIEPGLVAIHWSLQGTNTGQRIDGPPTGRSVSIKGASIIRLEGDKIISDQCYFDRASFDEQLQPVG
jgi:predicted ester cyclase